MKNTYPPYVQTANTYLRIAFLSRQIEMKCATYVAKDKGEVDGKRKRKRR